MDGVNLEKNENNGGAVQFVLENIGSGCDIVWLGEYLKLNLSDIESADNLIDWWKEYLRRIAENLSGVKEDLRMPIAGSMIQFGICCFALKLRDFNKSFIGKNKQDLVGAYVSVFNSRDMKGVAKYFHFVNHESLLSEGDGRIKNFKPKVSKGTLENYINMHVSGAKSLIEAVEALCNKDYSGVVFSFSMDAEFGVDFIVMRDGELKLVQVKTDKVGGENKVRYIGADIFNKHREALRYLLNYSDAGSVVFETNKGGEVFLSDLLIKRLAELFVGYVNESNIDTGEIVGYLNDFTGETPSELAQYMFKNIDRDNLGGYLCVIFNSGKFFAENERLKRGLGLIARDFAVMKDVFSVGGRDFEEFARAVELRFLPLERYRSDINNVEFLLALVDSDSNVDVTELGRES